MKLDQVRGRLQSSGFIVTADDRISERAAAALIGLSPKTLRNWRSAGQGPPSVSICRRAWYPLEQLVAWITATKSPAMSREVPGGPGRPSTRREAGGKLRT